MSSCYDSTSRLISPKNMTFDTVMVKKKKKKRHGYICNHWGVVFSASLLFLKKNWQNGSVSGQSALCYALLYSSDTAVLILMVDFQSKWVNHYPAAFMPTLPSYLTHRHNFSLFESSGKNARSSLQTNYELSHRISDSVWTSLQVSQQHAWIPLWSAALY